MVADAQTILILAALEFFDITGKVLQQQMQPLTNFPADLIGQFPQRDFGFILDFNFVFHREVIP